MWEEGNTRVNKTFFDQIKDSKTISLDRDEYDVFGDGTAILKAAPGHSPGHQVLVLNLATTGRVMIAGDLYHYPQERTLHRPPPGGPRQRHNGVEAWGRQGLAGRQINGAADQPEEVGTPRRFD